MWETRRGTFRVARAVPAASDGDALSIGTSTTNADRRPLCAAIRSAGRSGAVILIASEPLLIVGRKFLTVGDPVIPGHSRVRE